MSYNSGDDAPIDMQFSSLYGGEDNEHNNVVFAEKSKFFGTWDAYFYEDEGVSFDREQCIHTRFLLTRAINLT